MNAYSAKDVRIAQHKTNWLKEDRVFSSFKKNFVDVTPKHKNRRNKMNFPRVTM
jgi:hypothetical protein